MTPLQSEFLVLAAAIKKHYGESRQESWVVAPELIAEMEEVLTVLAQMDFGDGIGETPHSLAQQMRRKQSFGYAIGKVRAYYNF